MAIRYKYATNSYLEVTQPYVKLSAGAWTALKKVFAKTSGGWQEVWPMQIVYTHYGYGYNLNIHQLFGSPTTPAVYVFINKGYIGGTARGGMLNFALDTGVFPAGSQLFIINEGYISGSGGDGASFTGGGPGDAIDHPGPAGSALLLRNYVTINNSAGFIQGGGGGGGATGDFAGKSRYNATGGGGAGLPGGIGGRYRWGSYIAQSGTIDAGGYTAWQAGDWPNNGKGGTPGEHGLPDWRIINDDLSRMTLSSPAGIALYNSGYLLAGSTGMDSSRLKGPVLPGINLPFVGFTSYDGDGNYGLPIYVNLVLQGNPTVTASWLSGGSNILVTKVSNNRFMFQANGARYSSYRYNIWETGTIRFTATNSNGSFTQDIYLRVGQPQAPVPLDCQICGG